MITALHVYMYNIYIINNLPPHHSNENSYIIIKAGKSRALLGCVFGACIRVCVLTYIGICFVVFVGVYIGVFCCCCCCF